jgi:hypothetical protein
MRGRRYPPKTCRRVLALLKKQHLDLKLGERCAGVTELALG